MKYAINYQYKSKRSRPRNDGPIMWIEADDIDGDLVVLPNVGDFVSIPGDDVGEGYAGKVRSRLFRHVRDTTDEMLCEVNIVVEETDDDWDLLIN